MDIGKNGIYFNNNIEHSAKLIIAEIASKEKTRLFGELAILGSKAAIIITNPVGINCISCSFSGTDRVTLAVGKINSEQYQKIGDIKLIQSMNKSMRFSGNINFKNIKDVEVLAYNNIINANTQIKANNITYRTGSMPFFIKYDHINNKNTHNNLAYFKPWLVDDFGYSKFQVKKGSQISANEINIYVTVGSFRNEGEIDINSLFYFNVYKISHIGEVIHRITKDYQFNNKVVSQSEILRQAKKNYGIVNRGKIMADDFINGNFFTNEMINAGSGTIIIK
ncbi:MAG TPA: filamentous hemagglutinin N-terminal domain-containing protein [Arsenophonus nasoniae]|uniref:filamentous hemagglutinin N-terminal domain-containing protein n=1 Tax=Arsenophonus nasoniae TaxID=638 RepID=UPI003879327C